MVSQKILGVLLIFFILNIKDGEILPGVVRKGGQVMTEGALSKQIRKFSMRLIQIFSSHLLQSETMADILAGNKWTHSNWGQAAPPLKVNVFVLWKCASTILCLKVAPLVQKCKMIQQASRGNMTVRWVNWGKCYPDRNHFIYSSGFLLGNTDVRSACCQGAGREARDKTNSKKQVMV